MDDLKRTNTCKNCQKSIDAQAEICPSCGVRQRSPFSQGASNRLTAVLFALFLGIFGAHKFYTGQPLLGVLYFAFSCTGIPLIIGIVEAILYLNMSDEAFDARYFPASRTSAGSATPPESPAL